MTRTTGEQAKQRQIPQALMRAAAAAILLIPGATVLAGCEKKPVVPITVCSKDPIHIPQNPTIGRVDIKRQPNGALAPEIPELVKVAMKGAMVKVEYTLGDTVNRGTGVMVDIDGKKLFVSAAHVIGNGSDTSYVADLNKLKIIDEEGHSTGLKWARWQYQEADEGPSTPVLESEKSTSFDLLIGEPIKPIGSAALKLVAPRRGAWEALAGYVPTDEDARFFPGVRLFTGTTLYNSGAGAVLTGLAGPDSGVHQRNSGGPMVKYEEKDFGVTAIISGYFVEPKDAATLRTGYNVTLPPDMASAQVAVTTPSTGVQEMLRLCGTPPATVTPHTS